MNSGGLRRAGFTAEARRALKRACQSLFHAGTPLADALREMEELDDEHVRHLADFIRHSRRGFTRAEKRGTDDNAGDAPIIYDGEG
ncbi:MAG: hypothetical protein M3430_08240 [Acidobacteriota bacterium]|nr:hypothetical protein [Acidobacteriota bacterium]